MFRKILAILCVCALLTVFGEAVSLAASTPAQGRYQLTKVLVLSRHNLRSPIGTSTQSLTPHTWFSWTSGPGELSLRGGQLETIMGQYFRKYLVSEGLITENEQPQAGEMLFYANSFQRTIATAQYFSSGLLPVANVRIEHRLAVGEMDPVFASRLMFMSDAYSAAVREQLQTMGADAELGGIGKKLAANYQLLEQVLDLRHSTAAKSQGLDHFRTDGPELEFLLGDAPGVCSSSLQLAINASDALALQYYEEADPQKAAFGHRLTEQEWREISWIKDLGMDMCCAAPLVAVQTAHPLLQLMQQELSLADRKFTFICGHDSNLVSVLAALEVKPYILPQSVEAHTPIGGKLVIEKWLGRDGQEYASLSLVYQSTEQLRQRTILSLDNPPMRYPLELRGLAKNADGLYLFREVQQRFQKALDAYDTQAALAQPAKPAA